ncbi:MAG: 1,4-beta-xylanase, partial [Candidatus Sulfotelmatobacter sp.]
MEPDRLITRKSTFAFLIVFLCGIASAQTQRWSEQKAKDWYAHQPWLVGSNYVPKSAINQLEMWQAATFNPKQIDLELG